VPCVTNTAPQADLTRKRLERAGKLTSGLADEGVRWGATAAAIEESARLLVGDVFLAAGCIAYLGAFTGAFRCVFFLCEGGKGVAEKGITALGGNAHAPPCLGLKER
jgi:hypothetical protein